MSADDTNKIESTHALFPFAAVVSQKKAKEVCCRRSSNQTSHG
jgi:hypothetical protein